MTTAAAPQDAAPRASRRGQLIAALVVVAGVVAFFWPLLGGDLHLGFRDGWRMSLPERAFTVSELAAGRLPLWLPYEATGLPFFAQLTPGVLHPLNLVYLLAPLARGFAWNELAAFLTAALGAFAFARARGATPATSAVAGLVFGLGGAIASQTNLQYLVADATVPWALAGLTLALRRQSRRWLVAAAFAVACVILAGDPQSFIVAVGFGLAIVAGLPRGERKQGALRLGAWAAGGLALSAVQLAPALAVFAASVRGQGTSAGLAYDKWNFDLPRLIELAVPGAFGDSAASGFYTAVPGMHGYPWLPSVFLGAGAIALAVVGLTRDRAARALGVAGGLAFLLALGPHTGLADLAHHLPVWGGFQYGEKLFVHVSLVIAILAAHGLDGVLAGEGLRGVRTAALVLLAIFLAVALASVAAPSTWGGFLPALRDRAELPLAALAAGMFALSFALVRERAPLVFRLGWLLCAAGPVFANVAALSYSPARDVLTPPWAAEVIRADHRGLAPPRVLSRDALQVVVHEGVKELRRADPMQLLATDYNVLWGVENFGHYQPARSPVFEDIYADDAHLEQMARLYDTRYIVAPRGLTLSPAWKVLAENAELNLAVYSSELALPRTFVARSVYSVAGPGDALAAMRSPGFPAHDVVIAECPAEPDDSVREDRGRAELTAWSPQAATVTADLERPGMLVLNDAQADGWIARVDGVVHPICRINALVRGVRLAPGHHVVTFDYRPRALTVGLALSLLALLACAAAALRRKD